jgi:hypothetical protein
MLTLRFNWIGNFVICSRCKRAVMVENPDPFPGHVLIWHPAVMPHDQCFEFSAKSFGFKLPVYEAKEIAEGVFIEET